MDKKNKGLSIVEIARKRYAMAKAYYDPSRMLSKADIDFVYGDPDNANQYPAKLRRDVSFSDNANLTVNITAQTCKKIINNVRMNRPQGKVIPADGAADREAAEVISKWCRSVQSYSNADDASDHAFECMIHGGEGYWEMTVEPESYDSFKLVPRLEMIDDQFSVLIDPAARKLDRSDAEWGFIEEAISYDRAAREHPNIDPVDWDKDGNWVRDDTVIRCKYYYCDYVDDVLEMYEDNSTAFRSENRSGGLAVINSRKSQRKEWHVCLLLGGEDKPVDKQLWLGTMLPIISVYGDMYKVDGIPYFKGQVRDIKDVNRIINYSFSSAVKNIALQGDVPWTVPVEGVAGLPEWDNPQENHGYLRYNSYDEAGNPIPRPERNAPAVTPSAHMALLQKGIELAQDITGQFSVPGQHSKDTSGIALDRKNAQSELSTFHFVDNLTRAKRYEMALLVDIFPHIVEPDDIIRLLNEDGTEELAKVQPEMEGAYREPNDQTEDIKHIINPKVGRYDVAVTVGASYQTKRLEDADRIIDMTNKNPNLWQTHGDLIVKQLDFQDADSFVARFRKTMPPGTIDEEGQEPIPPQAQSQMQQMDAQIQQMGMQLENAQAQLQQMQAELQQIEVEKQRLDIENRQVKSMMQIKEAEHKLSVLAKQSLPKENEPKENEAKEEDNEGDEMSKEIDEIAYMLEESAIETNNQIAQLMQTIEQGNASMLQAQLALAEAINRPKTSKISIQKDAGGNYVGEKIET